MRSRLLTSLTGLALALTVIGVPPAAAAGTGQLRVVVVDEHGDPAPGAIQIVGVDSFQGAAAQEVSTSVNDLAPGAYFVLSVTPWGGMTCVGTARCGVDVLGHPAAPDGSLVVTEGHTTEVRIEGDVPAALHGSGRIGRPLTIEYSAGLQTLIEYFAGVTGLDFSPTVSWMRDGETIPGADGDSYVPGPADADHRVGAELTYTGVALTQFQLISGSVPEPLRLGDIQIGKQTTRTFSTMVRSTFTTAQQGVARIDVTAPGAVVTGKVEVAVGDWSESRTLRNGRAVVRLPHLAPGTYHVTAAYLGSGAYAASSAKPKRVKVTRS